MDEASKAMRRRAPRERERYFRGKGVDIGAGPDCIDRHGYECRNWDLKDGDAQLMAGVADGTFDFVHSSHCLEHMVDPQVALRNWIRVCKVGGYLVITVPDEELYEHELWPSRFNDDHKWSFRIYSGKGGSPKHVNVFDLLSRFYKEAEIVKIERIEDAFDWRLPREVDQTLPPDGPECAIEIVLRKKR
jgi:SAM-dependent methyltransferase